MRSFSGRLRLLSTGVYQFWPVKGEIIEGITDCEDVQIETPIEVVLDGKRLVEWNLDHAQPKAAVDLSVVDMALVKVIRRAEPRDSEVSGVKEQAKRLQDHLAWQLAGSRPVRVTPYVLAQEDARVGLMAIGWVQDRITELHPDTAPRHNHWHGLGPGCSGNVGGVAYMSSGQAWTCGGFDTSVHESKHSLRPEGVGHHTSKPGVEDYGGFSDMGAGSSPSFAAAHRAHIGIIEPNNIRRGPGRYFIVAPESSGLAEDECKLVYVDTGSQDRFRNEFAVSFERGRVWLTGKTGSWIMLWSPASLRVGESAVFEGIQVSFAAEQDHVAQVIIGEVTSPARPFPRIAIPDEPHPFDATMDGIWHHPGRHLQGLVVHVHDGEVVANYFGWRMEGEQFWIQCTGPITDGVARMDVWCVVQESKAVIKKTGRAWLWFHDGNHGVLKWRIDEPDRMVPNIYATQLERVAAPVASDFHGVFDAVSVQPHSGFSSAVLEYENEQGELQTVQIAYWFRYFYKHSQLKHEWLFLSGPPGEELTVEQPWGGVPGVPSADILKTWGTARIGKTWFRTKGKEAVKGKLERLV